MGRLHHVLSANYDNKDKWKDFLTFVNEEANRKVIANIINRFATMVSVQNQKKKFTIKDLEIEIENAKKDFDKHMEKLELEQQFKLEDIKIQIDNVNKDYESITKGRLVFLTEQAVIARKLDIKINTIASQNFNTQNTLKNISYYLE